MPDLKHKTKIIIHKLKKLFPEARMMLKYSDNWELLVAVMLSAQATDKKVNEISDKLFKKYRTLDDYSNADIHEFENDIRMVGLFRNKARNILASARIVKSRYNGKIPDNMDGLLGLPGVGRKTANVVLGNAFGKVEGIAVDTHVARLSRIYGLTREKDPAKIEKDLMSVVPKKDWFKFTYLMIEYGRKYCLAKKHDHGNCPLAVYKG
jgi:endonuclease III